MVGEHEDRLSIAPGKNALGGFLPREPHRGEMLARLELDRQPAGNPQPEHVLGVMRHARRVTMAPYRIDFEDVLQVPVFEREASRGEARFLADFANRRLAQRFALVLAAGDRLPETGVISAFDQQHIERRRVDHDKRGDRDLGRAHAERMRATISPSPSKKACGMSRVPCAATAVPWRSTATKPTSASNARPSSPSIARTAASSVSPRSTPSEIARVASVRSTNSPVPVADAATHGEA